VLKSKSEIRKRRGGERAAKRRAALIEGDLREGPEKLLLQFTASKTGKGKGGRGKKKGEK